MGSCEIRVPRPRLGSPGGGAGARDARAGEKASPARRVPARRGAPQAGRDIPSNAAQLSAPAGPPPLSLPRACQLGPNLISVLSVRTPLKPNSPYYQQLSYHTRLLPPRAALERSRAGLHAPGLWGPFLGLAVSLRRPPPAQVQVGPRLSYPSESQDCFLGNNRTVERKLESGVAGNSSRESSSPASHATQEYPGRAASLSPLPVPGLFPTRGALSLL